MPRTYEPIQTITGSGSSTMVFSTLPTTYTDLVLVITNLTITSNGHGVILRFNEDTGSNYGIRKLGGTGTNPMSVSDITSSGGAQVGYNVVGINSEPGFLIADIPSYRQTTFYKTVMGRGGDQNSEIAFCVSNWKNTAAITNISVITGAAFHPNTIMTLYGILAGSV